MAEEKKGRPIWEVDTVTEVSGSEKIPVGKGGNAPATVTVDMLKAFIRDGLATVAQVDELIAKLDTIRNEQEANVLRESLVRDYAAELRKIKDKLLKNTVSIERSADMTEILLSRVNDVQEKLEELAQKGIGGGGDGEASSAIIVDSAINPESKNPVQNKVIYEALQDFSGKSERTVYTLAEYVTMKEKGELRRQFYSVYKDGELYRMFFGETLIMKKADNGEKVTAGSVFPLTFPIVFT